MPFSDVTLSDVTLSDVAWLALAAYAVHILEEFSFDWRTWARAVFKLPVDWPDFYVTNAAVVVLGVAQAGLAPRQALAPLSFAALMLINATLFHLLPFMLTRGRFSPGLATAATLFYPVAVAAFVCAHREGRLSAGLAMGAFAIGALLMACPIAFLRLRRLPYFRQA